ncbi:AraC family transcriptional regulator [Paenibacillus sp. GYB003]|uniref:AraC family transcriptional regulator n=1 Tax=Paenibacillus sp. GYB003 TaxID=2994392 RepID=UPI002F96D2C2
MLFHQTYKTSIHRYLQRVRFEASLPLLRDRSLPVHEVARRVGLEVGSYIRMFKQMHGGITPGNWREKNE